jgi:hypothetical protein
MNVISYPVIEPIAHRIHEARTLRQSVQLSSDQVTLLDEWMQHELELQADSEWLARAAASDDQADFVGLDEAEAELAALSDGHVV